MIGDRTTAEAYALIAAALVLAIAIVLVSFAAHGADTNVTECSAARGHDGWYSYREIDGRRCWYRGQPGRSKTLLRWGLSSPRPPSAAVDRPEIVTPESSGLGADSTPAPEELTVRAQRNAEMLWQATAEDQEKAFTCCWPELTTLSVPSTPSARPLMKMQDRVGPIEMPQATPPARPLWPFMLLMVGLVGGAILLAQRRLT